MNNSKKYFLLLVALLSATFLYGELRYKLSGWNQHREAACLALLSHSGKELVDTYENTIAFNYTDSDSCIVVFKGPVDIFLKETYCFDRGIDAIKYWYEKKIFNIGVDAHIVPQCGDNDIRVCSHIGFGPNYSWSNALYYFNGDCVWKYEPDAETILTDASIYNNDMIISKARIGDSAQMVMELFDFDSPVPTKGLRSIVLYSTLDATPKLDFDKDSIEFKSNYHRFSEARFIFDADTLKRIEIGDVDFKRFFKYETYDE